MSEVYNCLKAVGNRLVDMWSFVSLGEHIIEETNHMHYKREINYFD